MKLTKFFALLFALSAMTLTFTACGDNEEDIDNKERTEDSYARVSFTIDTSTELELTIARSGTYSEVYNAKFDSEGIVTKVTLSLVYTEEENAKKDFEHIRKTSPTATLNGKTITTDITEFYPGYTRDEMREFFEYLKETANQPQ